MTLKAGASSARTRSVRCSTPGAWATSIARAIRRSGARQAIKVLPDAFAQDAERLALFEREAKSLVSLNHPHIAQIRD